MVEDQLRKAFSLMKKGDKKQASQIVQAVLKQDRDNITAWWLMANLLNNPERQKKALDRVLAVNPLHKGAIKMMEALEKGETAGYEPKVVREKAKPEQEVLTTQEIEFDWSKLEAKEGPKKKEDERMDESRAAKIGGYAMVGFAVIIVLVVIIFTGVPAIQNMLQEPPEQVVLDYFSAFSEQNWDTIRELTCTQYQTEVDAAQEAFTSSLSGDSTEELLIDMSGLTAETASVNDNTAQIAVGGEFSMTMSGLSMTFDINELMLNSEASDTTLTVIKEDGKWRICESSLNQSE